MREWARGGTQSRSRAPDKKIMKRLLIDTDIGIDCDDAMALGTALALEKKGLVQIEGITACTTREGASGCISAIADYYHNPKPNARYLGTPLECDKCNVYAKTVKDVFKKRDSEEESVNFLRRKLAAAEEKITLVSLGPLTVIAALLESPPDAVSPLNGRELVYEKVDSLYSMGGNFVAFEKRYAGRYTYEAEWNIYQDILAAKLVTERFPVPMIFCPYEIGRDVLSGEAFDAASPVGMSIRLFFEINGEEFKGKYSRASWDPLTVCAAAGFNWFSSSPRGRVSVDDEGKTLFTPGAGEHLYLSEKNPPEEIAEELNKLYRELQEDLGLIRGIL